MENNGISKPINKRQRFSRFMRYLSVAVVTVWLLVFLIASADKNEFRAVGVIVFFVFLFIIPLIGFWILDLFFCKGRKATLKSRQDSFMVPYRRSVNPWGYSFST